MTGTARVTPASAPSEGTGQTSPAELAGDLPPAPRTPPSGAPRTVRLTAQTAARTAHHPAQDTAQKGTSVATKKAASTATATKATASALAVREGEEAWTKEELDEVLGELREQQQHSLQVLTVQEAELSGLMKDSGDGAGQDQADMGATSFERDHELTVLNSERDKLAQIERALLAIGEGSYGICESCGDPIGKNRLIAFPRATLCMTCKQREERR